MINWLRNKNLFSFLYLVFFFTYFEIKNENSNTILGIFWIILEPLLIISTYIVFFSFILGIKSSVFGINDSKFSYSIYLLMGLVPWFFMNKVINEGINIFIKYKKFILKPEFPIEILSYVLVLKSFIPFCVSSSVLFLIIFIDNSLDQINLILLISTLILTIFFIRGFAVFVGCICLIIKDLHKVVPILLTILLFVSPIFYLPRSLGNLVFLGISNPLSYPITCFKFSLTGNIEYLIFSSSYLDFIILFLLSILFFLIQTIIIRNVKNFTWFERVL